MRKNLTFLESVMLVAGAGMGTGILTIPYAISRIGIYGTLIAAAAAYFASLCLYLIIADITLHSEKSQQLLGILQEHLFGKKKKALTTVFFIILTLLLLENLVVYIMCGADTVTALFGINSAVAKTLFYMLASIVIVFGIRGVGVGEKYSVALIGTVIFTLVFLSFLNIKNELDFSFGRPSLILAVYGLFMFAFSAIFAVIQVCNHIDNRKNAKAAVIVGLSINAALTLVFTLAVLLGSDQVTEIATIGLSESLGIKLIDILCSVFILLAMFTSYWSSGLAFADVIGEQLKIKKKWSWFVATLPTAVIAIVLPLSILDYVQIGAGALSVILVIVVLPAYCNAMKKSEQKLPAGRFGSGRMFVFIMTLFIFLMAVSSLIPIN